MADEAILKAGWYWGLYPFGSRLPKMPGLASRQTWEFPDQHGTFYLLEAKQDTLVPKDVPWIKFGHAPDGINTDPIEVGAIEDTGPSWEHYLYEAHEDAVEVIDDVADAAGKALKATGNAMWLIAGVLLVGGIGIFLARRK